MELSISAQKRKVKQALYSLPQDVGNGRSILVRTRVKVRSVSKLRKQINTMMKKIIICHFNFTLLCSKEKNKNN